MYELNPFEMTQRQLDLAARKLALDESIHALLREPMREYSFAIPLRLDNGTTRIFKGFRIQYNDARGPAKGGLRFHPAETIDTIRALAAWMTWKTAVVNIPLGGAKGGVICNPKELSFSEQERLARAYVRSVAPLLGATRDVLAPDVHTDAQTMAWMMDEYETMTMEKHPGIITGKPVVLGGSLGREGAVARGGIIAVREACKIIGMDSKGTTYAIQGFGTVGQQAAILHQELLGGGTLIAVSDSSGGILNPKGIDPFKLVQYKHLTGKVSGFPDTKPISHLELLKLPVEILYPAALENVITEQNAADIRAKLTCELADGPTTPEADEILGRNGVFVLPDLLANAGGVTVSYFEMVQNASNYYWSEAEVNQKLDVIMTHAFAAVLQIQKQHHVSMRLAAYMLAVQRIAEAMKLRGWV